MNFNARGADKRERTPNGSIHPCFIRSDAQIADELFQRTGERISPQYVGRLARRATEKIRNALKREAGWNMDQLSQTELNRIERDIRRAEREHSKVTLSASDARRLYDMAASATPVVSGGGGAVLGEEQR